MAQTPREFSVGLIELDIGKVSIFYELKKTLASENLVYHENSFEQDDATIIGGINKTTFPKLLDIVENLSLKGTKMILADFNSFLNDDNKWELVFKGVNEILTGEYEKVSRIIVSRVKRWKLVDELFQTESSKIQIIGKSNQWASFMRRIIETAYFSNRPILLMGASGTGKELIARLIHDLDNRREKKELVLLDCTTIVPELSGSEFYGHEKGAFTNAYYTREGAFALADGGTLFLDEIGEIPLTMQAGLLRVIQEGMYKRVGSNNWRKTDFRLICATNKNLQKEIKKGNFRKDLYYRIATSIFHVPVLKDHRNDIPDLVYYFLQQELNLKEIPEIDSAVLSFLIHRDYPGNIRELRQLVSRIATLYTGEGPITIGHIPSDEFPELKKIKNSNLNNSLNEAVRSALACKKSLSQIKEEVSYLATEIALESSGGNLQKAADKLHQSTRNLQKIRQKKKIENSVDQPLGN